MPTFIDITIALHGCLGAAALVCAAIAIGSTKGGAVHRRVGRAFAAAMLGAVVLAIPAIVARHNLLLATLGPFSAWMAATGWRTGRRRAAASVDGWLVLAGALSVVSMWGLGVWAALRGGAIWPVPLVIGAFGALLVRGEWLRQRTPGDNRARLRAHVGLMIGATIAATTAFAAVNLPALGVRPLVIWLGPTAVGVPLIRIFWRRYQGAASAS